jgi:hypothetical protein
MSAPADQGDGPLPPAPEAPAGEKRVHLYDAVSTQREHVLQGFDRQREAILKAVGDQRETALAPIRTVQARQAAGIATAGVDGRVLGPRGASSAPNLSAADRAQAISEIATIIRAIVAEEVHTQLVALLRNADERVRTTQPID